MQYPLCRHVHTKGTQCGSPALTGGTLCFYHQRVHQRHLNYLQDDASRAYLAPCLQVELLPLDDRESVQLALSTVINALALGQLETRRATALLYGLQLASMNAAALNQPVPSRVVRALIATPQGDLAPDGGLTDGC